MSARRVTWKRKDSPWHGEFDGARLGSDISVIFTLLARAGRGPDLHRHPYSETFIVQQGTVIFFDGATEIEASAGEIVVIPPGTPHRFAAKSGTVEMIGIHAGGRFVTEWLPDCAAAPR